MDGYRTSAGRSSALIPATANILRAAMAATMPRRAHSIHDGKNVPKMVSDGQCTRIDMEVLEERASCVARERGSVRLRRGWVLLGWPRRRWFWLGWRRLADFLWQARGDEPRSA